MATLEGIAERRLEPVVLDRMATEPVIILQGARSVGKSTLLRRIGAHHDRMPFDLDDLATREAARADPSLFVNSERPVLIDEFQHVPELLDAMKAELNTDDSPGRFVLTGSTHYASLPRAAQSLTGRAHRIEVRPLSQGEIIGSRHDLVSSLVADPAAGADGRLSTTERSDYVARVVAGGFPMALRRDRSADRSRWFDDYVALVLERDVLDLSRVRQRQQLPRLLRRLMSQTGQVLNIASAAADLGMKAATAEDYVKLLEAVFLVSRLNAWGTTVGSRVAASPKVHAVDPGLAAHLLRLTEGKLAEASAAALTQFGHLLETFVVGAVLTELDRLDRPVERGHWRTRDGNEVDLVVEREDGRVLAIEVKAGARVGSDLRGLTTLRRRLGNAFLGGVVFYTGNRSYQIDDRLHALPIDRLWT